MKKRQKKNKMPMGRSRGRAVAHYDSARSYLEQNNHEKAQAHIQRAVHYMAATTFGASGSDGARRRSRSRSRSREGSRTVRTVRTVRPDRQERHESSRTYRQERHGSPRTVMHERHDRQERHEGPRTVRHDRQERHESPRPDRQERHERHGSPRTVRQESQESPTPRQESPTTGFYAVLRSVHGERLPRPLVNAYIMEVSDYPTLVNIDPSDKESNPYLRDEVETENILPKRGILQITDKEKVPCHAFDREFMFGYFFVITNNKRTFIARYRSFDKRDISDLVLAGAQDLQNEKNRRTIWQHEPMYILHRSVSWNKTPLVNLWILRNFSGDTDGTLHNFYGDNDKAAAPIKFKSVWASAEQAPANQEPVTILNLDILPDKSRIGPNKEPIVYFVMAEHALTGPDGRLVTLRNTDHVSCDEYFMHMGWKTVHGVTVLSEKERKKVQTTERENVEREESQSRNVMKIVSHRIRDDHARLPPTQQFMFYAKLVNGTKRWILLDEEARNLEEAVAIDNYAREHPDLKIPEKLEAYWEAQKAARRG